VSRCLRGLIGLALVAAALALVPISAASADVSTGPSSATVTTSAGCAALNAGTWDLTLTGGQLGVTQDPAVLGFYDGDVISASITLSAGSFGAFALYGDSPSALIFLSHNGPFSASYTVGGPLANVPPTSANVNVRNGTIVVDAGCTPSPNPPCQPGSYSETGVVPCTLAPAGYFVPVEGATSVTPAPVGSFVAVEGAAAATPCPVGTYQDAVGQTSCRLASAGTYVGTVGAVAATSCAPGSYQPTAGAASCLLAEPGFFVDTTGAAVATPCPVGTFQDVSGQTSCKLAPAGTYVDTTGAVAAVSCPPGTDSPAGSDDVGDCVPVILDADGDGVLDSADHCVGTNLGAPGAPRNWLRTLLWSNAAGDFVDRDGRLSGFTVTQTHGCSATQIVADLEGGNLLERIAAAASKRYGFSRTTLLLWIATN
jgi:hypothetical protein